MNRIEIIKGQKSKKRPLAKARPAREQIACTLAKLEPGKWIHTDKFFKFLLAGGDGYSVVRKAWALYIVFRGLKFSPDAEIREISHLWTGTNDYLERVHH